jgi:hypothetical protein
MTAFADGKIEASTTPDSKSLAGYSTVVSEDAPSRVALAADRLAASIQ